MEIQKDDTWEAISRQMEDEYHQHIKAPEIQSINRDTIHKICSGQVSWNYQFEKGLLLMYIGTKNCFDYVLYMSLL